MKSFLLAGAFLLATASGFAQSNGSCSTLRECQLRNSQLNDQVKLLRNENARLNSELYQCNSSQGGFGQGDARVDLLLSLKNKKFETGFWRDNRDFTQDATVKFLFVNNTLKMQVTNKYGDTGMGNVTIPDQYGEFITINHPGAILNAGNTGLNCNYVVINEGAGVSKLELLQDVRNERYSCPKYLKLLN